VAGRGDDSKKSNSVLAAVKQKLKKKPTPMNARNTNFLIVWQEFPLSLSRVPASASPDHQRKEAAKNK